jgi:tryprostatin B 6-hydroxylase
MALMDIRQVITRLVWTFDIKFAPGDDGASFEGNALDAFMMTFGELTLALTPRETSYSGSA